jgi:hypothetical protein
MRVSWPSALIVGVALLSTVACNSNVYLGAVGDGSANVLWSATFEPGDLSEWTLGGGGGAYLLNSAAGPAVTSEAAHGGRYAGKLSVNPALGMMSETYLFRDSPSVPEAYYSAWFYIPSTIQVVTWLSIIHFNASMTGDGRNVSPTWDVNLYTPATGGLVAHLYSFVTQTNLEQTAPVQIPRDRWVHFEVLLRKATTATGRVAVWQDDAQILSLDGVVTTPNDWLQWNVGSASTDVVPSPAAIYVDDAAISFSRLGGAP